AVGSRLADARGHAPDGLPGGGRVVVSGLGSTAVTQGAPARGPGSTGSGRSRFTPVAEAAFRRGPRERRGGRPRPRAHQSPRRCAFFCACRFLSSRRRRSEPLVGRVGLRFLGTTVRACSPSRSRERATDWFWDWLRRSVALTESSVGGWVSRTPLAVLLRCWPPGPEATKKLRSQRSSSAASSSARA